MFIGEGPGFHEDKQGLPFVGRSGDYLEKMLKLINLRRDQVFIANVVKHRPPENRDPLPDEMAAKYVEMGTAMRTGKMWEDYLNHRPQQFGETKLEDFAKEFAEAYNAG